LNTHQSPHLLLIKLQVFGWKFPNVRLLADNYAKAGFTAYIPDVHEGDSLDPSFLQTVEPQLPQREQLTLVDKATATAKVGATLGPWLIKHREAVARPLIENFIRQVRLIPGTDKVGAIGFCWGGRYAILAGQKEFSTGAGKGIDAAYACHPSLVSIPADFTDVNVPIAFALGDKDSLLGEKEVGQIQELMQKKRSGEEGAKCESEVKIYHDQVHGFALRGDWSSEKDKKAMDDAEKQGIDWFNKYLS
jgi:dienelactone hydrolase